MHTVNGHNIRSCVTTRLIANRIIPSLPPSILHPFPSPPPPTISVVASSFSSTVPLFTFARPFAKRPQAKQTYGVLTVNKLSDFVIGLQQSAADGNRKKFLSRRDRFCCNDGRFVISFVARDYEAPDTFYYISNKPYVNMCYQWQTTLAYYA